MWGGYGCGKTEPVKVSVTVMFVLECIIHNLWHGFAVEVFMGAIHHTARNQGRSRSPIDVTYCPIWQP